MIKLPDNCYTSQEGMEEAFRVYFEKLHRDGNEDTLNALLNPEVLDCSYDEQTLTVAVDVKRWMTNPNLILHGGMTATVADMVMGLLGRYFSGGRLTPTIQMDVRYLSSVSMDERLICRAECTRAGFSVINVCARLWAEGREDRLTATASGSYYVNHKKP